MDPGVETGTASGMDFDIIAVFVVGVIWIGLFCWLAVVGWAKNRRLEREAYYRYQTERQILDSDGAGAAQILRLRNQAELAGWRKRREGLRLGGVVMTTLGVGVLVGLQFVDAGDLSLSGAGGIPLIVGFALLLYAYVLYPKFKELSIDKLPPRPGRAGGDVQD